MIMRRIGSILSFAALSAVLLFLPCRPAAGQRKTVTDASLWRYLFQETSQFREKLASTTTEIAKLESIYKAVKQSTSLAYDIYEVGTFITKNSSDISSLYSSYTSGVSATEDLINMYSRFLEEGKMSPSQYLRELKSVSNETTRLLRSTDNFINVFLDNSIHMEFMDRMKELKKLLLEWEHYRLVLNMKRRRAQAQAQADSAMVAMNRKILLDASAALGKNSIEPDAPTAYIISDRQPVPMESLYADKEATKAKLRQALSIFRPGSVYELVRTIIIIISAILLPVGIFLYFKPASDQHKDVFVKIVIGLLVSLFVLSILHVILGEQGLGF